MFQLVKLFGPLSSKKYPSLFSRAFKSYLWTFSSQARLILIERRTSLTSFSGKIFEKKMLDQKNIIFRWFQEYAQEALLCFPFSCLQEKNTWISISIYFQENNIVNKNSFASIYFYLVIMCWSVLISPGSQEFSSIHLSESKH